jgi:hypothetical protein
METIKFDYLKEFPVEFLSQISELLNDYEKFSELSKILLKSGLSFESSMYKKQFTVNSEEELKILKEYLNSILIPA